MKDGLKVTFAGLCFFKCFLVDRSCKLHLQNLASFHKKKVMKYNSTNAVMSDNFKFFLSFFLLTNLVAECSIIYCTVDILGDSK
jgi:hypothetical protein